jgi:hypothetical protein
MKIENGPETVELLIHHLALTQATARAEFVYRTIFGSQIALLKSMNVHGGRAPRIALEAIYDVAKANFPDLYSKYSLKSWIEFLVAQELISTADHEDFAHTTDGKEFLKWLTDNGIREDKSF